MGMARFCRLFDEYHHVIIIPGEDVKKREWDEIKFPIGGLAGEYEGKLCTANRKYDDSKYINACTVYHLNAT